MSKFCIENANLLHPRCKRGRERDEKGKILKAHFSKIQNFGKDDAGRNTYPLPFFSASRITDLRPIFAVMKSRSRRIPRAGEYSRP